MRYLCFLCCSWIILASSAHSEEMLPLRSDDHSSLPMLDLTVSPPDLWQRIRNGFGMPDLDDKRVINQQAWYLNRPGTLKIIFERSRRYLYHIVTELEKRGMPTELALLPMVESAFNPLAYSPARALGLWQFIPATGRRYDLNQNAWVDDRRDIIASTQAALDYLQTIYEMHGDWQLALASYNWGENAVARAVTKNKAKNLPTDYASLSMPNETRYYVPKLQAFKNIIAQPALFGISMEPLPNEPYFGTVHISDDVDIALAARLAEIPLAEFIALNPAYHRPVILGTNSSPLVFPVNHVQTFLENLERHEAADKPLTSWTTYTLKPKEKLESVATRFHITLAKLKQLNGITPRTKVRPGFALLVPGAGASAEMLAALLPKAPDPSKRKTKTRHKKKKTR
ncbi:MAG: transglycosylase SLT domain-containing protein [Rhodocyclaceae bacterium]|nr:transglycosylase SLT domain-containing protein [Rhodocyclaceae bacterium]